MAYLYPAVAALGAAFFCAAPAAADLWRGDCQSRDEVVAQLARKWREDQVAAGLMATGHLVEVFASEGGETWSLLVSRPDGRSCILWSGLDWRATPEPWPKTRP